MILVTGGAGFIGSALVHELNTRGEERILVADRLGTGEKWRNLRPLRFLDLIDRDKLPSLLEEGRLPEITAILHMGACSATTETDGDYLLENNYRYPVRLARWCASNGVRFIYASSAATYGDGSQGYTDDPETIPTLLPLNKYGWSKQLFDRFILNEGLAGQVVGLKFFNVFGPNEYHKGEMRSVLHKFFPDARDGKTVRLFKSYREGIPHGGQSRDFVYVKDIARLTLWFLEHPETNGIYNAGTGTAVPFSELIGHLFDAVGMKTNIRYVGMPEDLSGRYQYHTQADLTRLRAAGYDLPFTPPEEAVRDYVRNYLMTDRPYLGE